MSLLVFLIFVPLAVSSTAFARFQEMDADAVDDEDAYGSETYNDKLSYRYPLSWDRLWDAHDVGFRVAAGSLNIRRFAYERDVKIVAAPDGDVALGYKSAVQDDTMEKREDSRFFVNGRIAGAWRVGLLGDGGRDKEYGDVGGEVIHRRDRGHEVRAAFWSVDHYYDTKKVEPDDRRTGKPDTTEASGRWAWSGASVEFAASADHDFRWSRPSRGEEYDYERREASYRVTLPSGEATAFGIAGQHEFKREALERTGTRDEMSRRVDVVEPWATRSLGGEQDVAGGVALISRRAHYNLKDKRRLEAAPYATWSFPLASPRHFAQLGAFVNEVRRVTDEDQRTTEVKAQAAWDYRLTEAARLLLNTTWDLDQLRDDWPYQERPARPWGGGAIQMLAVF